MIFSPLIRKIILDLKKTGLPPVDQRDYNPQGRMRGERGGRFDPIQPGTAHYNINKSRKTILTAFQKYARKNGVRDGVSEALDYLMKESNTPEEINHIAQVAKTKLGKDLGPVGTETIKSVDKKPEPTPEIKKVDPSIEKPKPVKKPKDPPIQTTLPDTPTKKEGNKPKVEKPKVESSPTSESKKVQYLADGIESHFEKEIYEKYKYDPNVPIWINKLLSQSKNKKWDNHYYKLLREASHIPEDAKKVLMSTLKQAVIEKTSNEYKKKIANMRFKELPIVTFNSLEEHPLSKKFRGTLEEGHFKSTYWERQFQQVGTNYAGETYSDEISPISKKELETYLQDNILFPSQWDAMVSQGIQFTGTSGDKTFISNYSEGDKIDDPLLRGVIKHCMEKYIHRFGIRLNGVIASNSRKDNSSGRLGVYKRRFIPNTNLYDSSRLGGGISPMATGHVQIQVYGDCAKMERVKKECESFLIEKKRRTNQPGRWAGIKRTNVFGEGKHPYDAALAVWTHECHHAMYDQLNLKDKWKEAMDSFGCTSQDRASVSDYAQNSHASDEYNETWAEVGAAIEVGSHVPENLKKAYEATIEYAKTVKYLSGIYIVQEKK